MSARCKARLILFSGFFFPIGLTPRGDKHTRSDTREPRLRNTPLGCPDPLLSGVHSVLTDGRRQRTKLVAPLATTDSSADGSLVPHRGEQLHPAPIPTAPTRSRVSATACADAPIIARPEATHTTTMTPSHVTIGAGGSAGCSRAQARHLVSLHLVPRGT
jgi:hypothetical protein